MIGPLQPIALSAVLDAAATYAGLVLFVVVLDRLTRGSRPFLAATVAVAALTATTPFSLGPLVTSLLPLSLVALAVSLVLALSLRRRAGERPDEDRSFLGVPSRLLVRHLSWLGVGAMNVAFAYRQYDLFGFLQPQMGLHVALWWGYLYLLCSKEDDSLLAWQRRRGRPGLLDFPVRLVLVPLVFSLGGWVLLGKVLWQPPLWKLAGMGLAAGAGLAALWVATDARVRAAAEVYVLVCIALTTGFESPVAYLMPVAALLFGGARVLGGAGVRPS